MGSNHNHRRSVIWLASLILLTLAAHLSAQPNATPELGGRSRVVARVYYDHPADIARLHAYDVWEYHNVAEGYVLAAVDGAEYAQLRAGGWRVVIDEATTARMQADRATAFFDDYRTVDELYAGLDALAAAYPELTEPLTYGQSYCLSRGGCQTLGGETLPGYPLRAIRVTNEAVAGSSTISGDTVTRGAKPVFFLMANIHAREITTPEIAMRFLDWLLSQYGTDANITWLVDWHEVWIVPTVNPDGHWLVELGERPEYGGEPFYQRKNAKLDNDGDGEDDCPIWPPPTYGGGAHFGVDLNRNHSFAWGGDGSDDDPCSVVYRGAAEASESEVARLEALLRALFADRRGPALHEPAPRDTSGVFITLHSYGDLILWPWGHAYINAPNKTDLKAIGDKMASYNGYLSCQSAAWDCLYAAAGASDDWAYGELGVAAFTYEIGYEFMPPYSDIDAVQWPENRPALLYAAAIARAPYQLVHGPDALNLLVAGPGAMRSVSATLSTETTSGRPVAAAEYTLDAPPWQEEAVPLPLAAADGAFDTPTERVLGTLDTSALLDGRHTLFIRGQDDRGNWGPVSAVFFTVGASPSQWLFLPAVVSSQ